MRSLTLSLDTHTWVPYFVIYRVNQTILNWNSKAEVISEDSRSMIVNEPRSDFLVETVRNADLSQHIVHILSLLCL